jgi:putative acetyltransferase
VGVTEASSVNLRKAFKADAEQIAIINRKARETAMPYLPNLHTPEEDIKFFRDNVLESCEVWVAESNKILGFCAFKKGWVDHLYISPEYQGQGIGKSLLMKVMENNERLQLWTFQKNAVARNFYERQGFTLLKVTDGKDNEEKEPDALYQWTRCLPK